ncbi:MAG: hypothetical protein MAG795_01107 [Candidatus Woesearchaeota archaeon]|nr:hypothetical protein [Candidatus Woesearchaeota archaeon]
MLTLHFVPHYKIESLSSDQRIKKLLKLAKQNKIVVLEGRLRKEEETELIKQTMEEINTKFKGIELAVIYPESESNSLVTRAKNEVINFLLGERQGMTIIGPATIVKKIKKDPDQITLLTKEKQKKKRKK